MNRSYVVFSHIQALSNVELSCLKKDSETGRHTQRPLADHTAVDQWDDQTELAGGVSVE